MKKSMKKVLCLILAIAMINLVGCSKDATNEEPSNAEVTTAVEPTEGAAPEAVAEERTEATFTMYTDHATPDYLKEETPIGKQILANTKVTLEIEYLVDDADTKEGILLASGDLPDIVSSRTCNKFIEAGVVVPLDEYIEKYGEDLKRVYGEDLEYLRAADGHIYNISNSRSLAPWSKQPGKAMYIQQAVLKEFGYPEITTLDQYFDIIKKYQDKYPEIDGQKTIGFTMLADDWRFGMGVLGPIKFLFGYGDDGGVFVDQVDGKYKSRIIDNSPEAKAYFSKVNQLYLDGYFDESSFTSNYDQYVEKIAQGRVLGMHDQYWEIESVNAALLASDHPERAYVGLPIVMEEGITEHYNNPIPIEADKGIMISTSCKDPERAFQFLNDLCKEENQKLNFWGEEGVEYTKEADGSFTFTDDQLKLWQDDAYLRQRGIKSFDYPFPVISNLQTYTDGNCGRPNGIPEFMKASYTELDKEVCAAYGWETLQSGFTYDPTPAYGQAWSMDPAVNGNDDAAYAKQMIDDLDRTYIPKLIFAKAGEFESIWNEFTGKIDKVDVKSFTDFTDAKIVERIEKKNPSLK
jgi:putative aldouronate transport system substrate-binding protein